MFLVFLFQVVSGFAMYASMSKAWFPQLFKWAVPLFGGDYGLRQWHYMAMWFFIIFTIVHVYLVFYHDYVEGHGVMSSMVGGWKFVRPDTLKGNGRSWFPLSRPAAPLTPHGRFPPCGRIWVLRPHQRCRRPRCSCWAWATCSSGDEGVGVHACRALEKETWPAHVRLVDGGTGGFHLLESAAQPCAHHSDRRHPRRGAAGHGQRSFARGSPPTFPRRSARTTSGCAI